MEIRSEQPADIPLIYQLTDRAFAPMSFSDGTEPAVIDALREAGDLTLSLVALKDNTLVGHVAFSPVQAGVIPKDGMAWDQSRYCRSINARVSVQR